jgi:tetratricopeptide (TPR) repeat protein
MINLKLEQFKQLPRRPDEIWQGGIFDVPFSMEDSRGKVLQSRVPVWVSTATGLVSQPCPVGPDDDPMRIALDSLLDFALREEGVGRPAAVEVNDPGLAAYLQEHLPGAGIRIECVPALAEMQKSMNDMAEELARQPELPGALDAKGVTVERMRAFAEAAAAFYAARPWEQLTDEDLIRVEQPKAPAELGYFSVLGAGEQTLGLGFFRSVEQFEEMQSAEHPGEFLAHHSICSLTFGPIMELPFADADLWERHKLPVEAPDAYPCAMCHGPKTGISRPTAKKLAFLEGLLQAVALATEEQLDAGRWATTVSTFDGPKKYRLALLTVLEDTTGGLLRASFSDLDPQHARRAMERSMANIQRMMSQQEFESIEDANHYVRAHGDDLCQRPAGELTPLEQAQELMYEAWEARGRKRRKFAKQALDISADCADAYVLLAEETSDAEAACELFRKGVQAGESALGPETFKEDAGHFWGILETRPYMRARAGLAQCLWVLGEQEEAVRHYNELLRLNPNDNQSIRYLLAPCLLQLGRDKELARLIEQHHDGTAHWQYLEVLSLYRREGDTPLARKRLKHAVKSNKHVPDFLLGRRESPLDECGIFSPGEEDEAACCATELEDGWRATPGALAWLEEHLSSAPKRR